MICKPCQLNVHEECVILEHGGYDIGDGTAYGETWCDCQHLQGMVNNGKANRDNRIGDNVASGSDNAIRDTKREEAPIYIHVEAPLEWGPG